MQRRVFFLLKSVEIILCQIVNSSKSWQASDLINANVQPSWYIWRKPNYADCANPEAAKVSKSQSRRLLKLIHTHSTSKQSIPKILPPFWGFTATRNGMNVMQYKAYLNSSPPSDSWSGRRIHISNHPIVNVVQQRLIFIHDSWLENKSNSRGCPQIYK